MALTNINNQFEFKDNDPKIEVLQEYREKWQKVRVYIDHSNPNFPVKVREITMPAPVVTEILWYQTAQWREIDRLYLIHPEIWAQWKKGLIPLDIIKRVEAGEKIVPEERRSWNE